MAKWTITGTIDAKPKAVEALYEALWEWQENHIALWGSASIDITQVKKQRPKKKEAANA